MLPIVTPSWPPAGVLVQVRVAPDPGPEFALDADQFAARVLTAVGIVFVTLVNGRSRGAAPIASDRDGVPLPLGHARAPQGSGI
jgi:hypothetical protein